MEPRGSWRQPVEDLAEAWVNTGIRPRQGVRVISGRARARFKVMPSHVQKYPLRHWMMISHGLLPTWWGMGGVSIHVCSIPRFSSRIIMLYLTREHRKEFLVTDLVG